MRIIIVGGGVVGAAIAYELSLIQGLEVTLLERQNEPAMGSTGAALGILMGIISHKTKGRAWRFRQTSLQRYETLLPELEALTGISVPCNRQGIVELVFDAASLPSWDNLISIRRESGWQLQWWNREILSDRCPQVESSHLAGAVYSPRDRQIHPAILTRALIEGARGNGATCCFGVAVNRASFSSNSSNRVSAVETREGSVTGDAFVLAAGLGSLNLTASLERPLSLRPVLGQAMRVRLEKTLGRDEFQPVVSGEDVHLVPLGKHEYWLGATVEFPSDAPEVIADPALLEQVREMAISFCPEIAKAEILETWQGKRPRPEGQAAPVIGNLGEYENVFLATGHYRNGVLLAPATAMEIKKLILAEN